MSLPDGHLEAVCRFGQGEKCCAYLTLGGKIEEEPGWMCAKDPDMLSVRRTIEARLAAGTLSAKGDNCSGPPDFKSHPQAAKVASETLRLDLTTPDEFCAICKTVPPIGLLLEGKADGEAFRVRVCRSCLSEYAPGLLAEIESAAGLS